jgi:hypothetical protein
LTVNLGAVEHDVGVRLQVLLRRVSEPRCRLGDRRSAELPQRRSSVPEVVRAEPRYAGCLACPGEGGAEGIGVEPFEHNARGT